WPTPAPPAGPPSADPAPGPAGGRARPLSCRTPRSRRPPLGSRPPATTHAHARSGRGPPARACREARSHHRYGASPSTASCSATVDKSQNGEAFGAPGGASSPHAPPTLHREEPLVATAIGHAGELLHVDVDQLAATGRLDPADHPTGRAVQPGQPVDAVADQDPVHRRGRNTDDPGQAG